MGHDFGPEAEPVSAEIVPIVPNVSIEPPVVVRQQEELERELAPIKAASVRAAPGSKGKAAFTLRLDPERHLQLRLACAVAHKSAQQFVVAALDKYLASQPAVAQLAQAASVQSGASSGK
jgi:predicted HicB family RNase H-like nuclease